MGSVIKVENLSKAYQLGSIGTGTISRDLERYWARLRGKEDPFLKIGETNDRTSKGNSDVVWSLKDINLEIQQGDAVGIIGRNGAGKSTLLKILSRVTGPTIGSVKVKGRIASLLEVGTGFHPELSGRENIYLNGSILGMRKKEITRKLDEIVDFAGIERYLDTPVKRYSSGMYVRLAFAVAAHLESEILIVDEVLAVGDAEFQKKCLGKMGEVSKGEGRTVLFVSHQLSSISTLCNSCVLLNNGRIAKNGATFEIVSGYLKSNSIRNTSWARVNDEYDCKHFSPQHFYLLNSDLNKASVFSNNSSIGVCIEGDVKYIEQGFCIGFAVYDAINTLLFWSLNTDKAEEDWVELNEGSNRIIGWIPPHLLNEGEHRVELITAIHFKEWFCKPEQHSPAIYFHIKGGLSKSPHWMEARPGVVAPVIGFEKL